LSIEVVGVPSLAGLNFVKAGFTTRDCDDPGAVVYVPSGGRLDLGSLRSLWGESPVTPPARRFYACSVSTGGPPGLIPVELTYKRND
jgi:hypothetical protein